MVLRREFNIQGNSGLGRGPLLAFNAFSTRQIADAIAQRGLAPTVAATAAEGAAAGASRGAWWGAAAGAALGIGLVTWAWWKSHAAEVAPGEIHVGSVFFPDDLQCLMNPYDMSLGCMMTRLKTITTMPASRSTPQDPRQIRASASTVTRDPASIAPTAVGLSNMVTASSSQSAESQALTEWVDAMQRRDASVRVVAQAVLDWVHRSPQTFTSNHLIRMIEASADAAARWPGNKAVAGLAKSRRELFTDDIVARIRALNGNPDTKGCFQLTVDILDQNSTPQPAVPSTPQPTVPSAPPPPTVSMRSRVVELQQRPPAPELVMPGRLK